MFVALHLGAGFHAPKYDLEYKKLVHKVCTATMEQLQSDLSSMDAVEFAIRLLEINSLTNCGIAGSNLTLSGAIECDAAVMNAQGFGSVAALPLCHSSPHPVNYYHLDTKIHPNPIGVAHAIWKGQTEGTDCAGRQPPIMLTGIHAHDYASKRGLDTITLRESQKMITSNQLDRYEAHKSILSRARRRQETRIQTGEESEFQDTVGAIVIDKDGHMATGVSSGGISLKREGRVGEAALPGSGVWFIEKDGESVACSLSGTGEQIMKTSLGMMIVNQVHSSHDVPGALKHVMDHTFLDCPLLANESTKYAGALVVKHTLEELECWWAHTTPSFCIGYCTEGSPVKFEMSRKKIESQSCVSGRLIKRRSHG